MNGYRTLRSRAFRFLGLLILSCVFFTIVWGSRVYAANPRLADTAGVLSADERNNLNNQLDQYSQELNVDIVVITVDQLSGGDAATEGVALYRQAQMGFSNGDAAILLISMEDRDWGIAGVGSVDRALNSEARDYLGNTIVKDLGNENYYQAFSSFAEKSKKIIADAQNGKKFKKPFRAGFSAAIAAVISGLASLITVGGMKGSLKSVHSKTGASEYVKKNSMNMKEANERFLYTQTSKTKKESSSSNTTTSGNSYSGTSGKF